MDPDQAAPTVCHESFLNILADNKTDDIYCDWRFKGQQLVAPNLSLRNTVALTSLATFTFDRAINGR